MNSNNKHDCMDAGDRATHGAVADDCMDAGGTIPRTGEVEQRREQLPTTAWMQEVEQRREQLPRATQGAVANDCTGAKPAAALPGVKMVRYRLDVGGKHQVTSEELRKLLIEESGVDKNNIVNISIQNDYTFVELPDEMPQDIFLHLKSVEIKQHKLDIKRVKARNKKRYNNRRGRQRT